ncbi:MAG: sugar phosphate isomerase/epimerase [Clostridia bacterium]|nr:sugar phosphate isomerase/epimerase [Clostridia bacterium]
MKIGITAGSYTRYGISEGSRKAKEHGYDCFDYSRFVDTETEFFKLPEAEFKAEIVKQRELIEAEGIVVWQAHSPWRHPARDSTPEERAERLTSFLKAIRGAGYIGATHFVVHAIMPFGTNSPENPELMRDMNAEFMGRLAKEAQEYGVKHIDVENLPFPALPINHTNQCLDFAKRMNKETNSDIFKVCLDTGHSNFCGENPADAVRMLGKEYLGSLHVHDNNGKADQHLTPGNGNIDWVDFSNALAEIGFDGCFSYETNVPNSIPAGEERDRLERELAQTALKLAKRI